MNTPVNIRKAILNTVISAMHNIDRGAPLVLCISTKNYRRVKSIIGDTDLTFGYEGEACNPGLEIHLGVDDAHILVYFDKQSYPTLLELTTKPLNAPNAEATENMPSVWLEKLTEIGKNTENKTIAVTNTLKDFIFPDHTTHTKPKHQGVTFIGYKGWDVAYSVDHFKSDISYLEVGSPNDYDIPILNKASSLVEKYIPIRGEIDFADGVIQNLNVPFVRSSIQVGSLVYTALLQLNSAQPTGYAKSSSVHMKEYEKYRKNLGVYTEVGNNKLDCKNPYFLLRIHVINRLMRDYMLTRKLR